MEKQAGVVVVLTKNGEQGVKVPLRTNTPCSLGSSVNATIRMNPDNDNLRDIHCVINVNAKGFAVLVNKSKFHPVVLNGRSLLNEKVLINNDIFEVCGKKFQYVNSRMTEEKAKLYKKETGVLFMPTPLKSRVTESVAPGKTFATPRRTITKKQSMSTSKQSKKISPRGSKSATKPKPNYSPLETRRSLFKGKISASTSKIPVKSKLSPQMAKATSTPKIFNSSSATVSKTPDSILAKLRNNKTPFATPKSETSVDSFLQNESLCKSARKSSRRNSLRRFVTIRGGRRKSMHLSFDSSSAEEQTPSKTNISGESIESTPFNASKRTSIRSSVRGGTIDLKGTSLNDSEAELLTPHLKDEDVTGDESEFTHSKRKSVRSSLHGSTVKSAANSSSNYVEAQPPTPSTRSLRKSSISAKLLTSQLKDDEETSTSVTSKRKSVRSSVRGSTNASMNNTSLNDDDHQPETPHLKDSEEISADATPELKRKSVRSSLRGSTVVSKENTSSDYVETEPQAPLLQDEGISEALTDATPEFNISERRSLRSSLRGSTSTSKENTSADNVNGQQQTPHLKDEALADATLDFNISKRKSVRSSLRGSTIASKGNMSFDNIETQPQTSHLHDDEEISAVLTDATPEFNTSKRRSLKSSLRGSIITPKENTSADNAEVQQETPHLKDDEEALATLDFNISKRKSVRSSLRGSTIASRENTSFDNVETQPQTSHLHEDEEISAVLTDPTPEFNISKRRSLRSSLRGSFITPKENTSADNAEVQQETPHLKDDEEALADATLDFNISKRKSVRSSLRSSTMASKENTSFDNVETQPQTSHLHDDEEISEVLTDATPEFNISKRKSLRSSLRGSIITPKENTSADNAEVQQETPHPKDDEEVLADATLDFNISKRKSVRSSLRVSTIASKEDLSFDNIETQPQISLQEDDEELSAVLTDATPEFNISKRRSLRNSLRGSTSTSKENTSSDNVEGQQQTPHLKDEETSAVAINSSFGFNHSKRKSVRSSLRDSTITSKENTSSDFVEAQPQTPQLKDNEESSPTVTDATLELNISKRRSLGSFLHRSTTSSLDNTSLDDVETHSQSAHLKDDEVTSAVVTDATLEFNISMRKSVRSSLRSTTITSIEDVEAESLTPRQSAEEETTATVTNSTVEFNISVHKSIRSSLRHSAVTSIKTNHGETSAKSSRSSRVRAKSLATQSPYLKDDKTVPTTLRNNRVRPKSLTGLKPRSSKKRYSVHAVSLMSGQIHGFGDNVEEEADVTTPVMSHNISKSFLSAPRIHHVRKSRLDDAVNESLHMDDSGLETPVIHETSRRSLAKKSTAKLQESLRLISPDTSLDMDENERTTPDVRSGSVRRFSDEEILSTPLKAEESDNASKSTRELSNMKVSITSTPKEPTPRTGVKRQLSTSLNEVNTSRTKILRRSSRSVTDENLKQNDSASPAVQRSRKSTSTNTSSKLRTNLTAQENFINDDSSLLESTVASSIVYETDFSKVKTRTPLSEKKELQKAPSSSENIKTPKNDLSNISGIGALYVTPEAHTSQSTELHIPELAYTTDYASSSFKADVSANKGKKNQKQTPTKQKSPENDLRNVRGIRRLLQTPKEVKSPENDLTVVRGLRKLMQTPKPIKSPKNDLRNIQGLRNLMQTPKQIKSPENDLSDVRGVRQLLQTPQQIKSPENDLSDVRGVKALLKTPKPIKSPENDLRNVSGLGVLLQTPQEAKTTVVRTRKQVKSPENDLRNVSGLRKLMQTPKEVKSPKNDLRNVSGVRDLFEREEESAFDRLVQKKVVTYKRKKSWSEAKKVSSISDSASPSATVTPRVQEWVSQQILLNEEKVEKESDETVEVSEQPPSKKRVTRKAQAADFLDPVSITTTTTTRSTRQRKLVVEESNKEEKKAVRTTRKNAKQIEEQNEVESMEVTPAKTTRRKRQQVAIDNDESTQTEVESAKRTRRQNTKEADEKPPGTPIKQQRQTRSRKQTSSQNEQEQEDVVHTSVDQPRKTRSRKQNNSKQSVNETEKLLENAKTLEKQQKENDDTPIQQQKQTRSRKQNNKQTANEAEKSLVNASTSAEKQESSVQEQKQTRSRKQKNNKPTKHQSETSVVDADVSEKQQDDIFDVEQKQTRSNKRTNKKQTVSDKSTVETDVSEIADKSPKVKRQNRNKKDIDNSEEALIPVNTQVEKTKRTRARAAKETAKVEPIERSTKSPVKEEAGAKRVTRRAKVVVVEDQPSPLRRSARTRK